MRLPWKREVKPRWPAIVNGLTTRPEHGECPECRASERSWCDPECTRLDPLDYR